MWLLRFVEKCHISDHDGSGQDHGESFVFIPKFQGTFPKNNCKILVIECENRNLSKSKVSNEKNPNILDRGTVNQTFLPFSNFLGNRICSFGNFTEKRRCVPLTDVFAVVSYAWLAS